MKTNYRGWFTISLIVLLRCLCPTLCLAETDGDNEKLAGDINEYLQAIVPFGFHGAVLIAKDGQIILNQGYGLANLVNAIPIRPNTIFDIGSITKVFTAAAVLKLEMREHLRTKDQLHQFFSDLPKNTGEITLHQLLTHSSGLPSGFGKDYEEVDRDEFIRKVREADLDSAPGESFSYSNAGYSLLAIVVEMAADGSWENYIKDEILRPIGAKRTGYKLPEVREAEVAHLRRSESVYPNPLARPGPYWNLLGNGGLLSTTMDLYKLVRSLSDNSVLSAEAREKMTTSHVAWTGRDGVHYGYGLEIGTTDRGTTVLGHSGGSGEGVNAVVKWFVGENAVLVFLSNDFLYSLPPIFGIPQTLERAMFGEPLPQVPSIANVSQVEPYSGRYRLEGGPAFDLTPAGSGVGLRLVEEEDTQRWDSETLPLPKTHLRLFVPASPKGGYVFYDPLQQVTSHISFELDDDGQPSLLVESEGVRVKLEHEPIDDGP